MKELERQQIIEQAKKNFWDQKGEEFGHTIFVIAAVFILIPMLGMLATTVDMSLGWNFFNIESPFAQPIHYADSYWEFFGIGFTALGLVFIIGFVIYEICFAIKQFIDSNMKKAFNRAIDEVHVTKSKRGGKTK